MRLFTFITLIFSNLFANSSFYEKMLNEDEISIFFNSVNVITGNYYYDFEIKVNSIEPIVINPTYINLTHMDQRFVDQFNYEEYLLSGWKYLDYLKAFLYKDRLEITLKDGTILSFNPPDLQFENKGFLESKKAKKKRKEKEEIERNKKRVLNFLKKNKGAYFFNLENNEILDYTKITAEFIGQDTIKLTFPNGYERVYKKSNENNIFLLFYETTLSKNKIAYSYDKFNNVIEIKSSNLNESITYGFAKFDYKHPDPNFKKLKDKKDFIITTSDNKKFEFIHDTYYPKISNKERSTSPFYILSKVVLNNQIINFDYHKDYKRTDPLLSKRYINNTLFENIEYYLLGNKNVENNITIKDEKDQIFERVSIIKYPMNDKLNLAYKFFYDPGVYNQKKGSTTIIDSDDNKIIYYYNEKFKIEKIEKYQNINGSLKLKNTVICEYEDLENFESPLLISKIFKDSKGNIIFEKKYLYDSNGNKTELKIIDNKNVVSKINHQYSNDFKNNIIEEKEGDLTYKYEYLKDTNLVQSKITLDKDQIKQRNFYEYNSDYILTKEIEDDGINYDENDLTDISYRTIRKITLNNTKFANLIDEINEYYFSLNEKKEKLLKKEKFFYLNNYKVSKKDIYNQNNEYAYSLYYGYDDFNNLTSQTDPIGRKKTFSYDFNDNLTSLIDFDEKVIKNFAYDIFNNLIKQEILANNKKYVTTFEYDIKGNLIKKIDPLKNETNYFYDSFSNLIKKEKETTISINEKQKKVKEYSYDDMGRKIISSQDQKKYFYNALNQITKIIYPDNLTEEFFYYPNQMIKTHKNKTNLITNYEYDYKKRIIEKTLFIQNKIFMQESYKYNNYAMVEKNDNAINTKYTYSDKKLLISTIKKSKDDIRKTIYTYDDLNRLLSTTNEENLTTIEYKDKANRVIEIIKKDSDNLYYRKLFSYDNFNNIIKEVFFINDSTGVEKKDFDDFSRVLKIEDALNSLTTFEYDDFYEVNKNIFVKKSIKIDPLNYKEISYFNIEDKLLNKESINPFNTLFLVQKNKYDLNLNLLNESNFKLIDQNLLFTDGFVFKYDVFNRKTYQKEIKKDFSDKEIFFEYDALNNIVIKTKPDDIKLFYHYDAFSNLIKLKSSDKTIDYEYEYNSLNQLTKAIDNNINKSVKREYSPFNELKKEFFLNDYFILKEFDKTSRCTLVKFFDNSSIKYIYNPMHLKEIKRFDKNNNNIYSHKYLKYDLSNNLIEEKLLGDLGQSFIRKDILGRNVEIDTPFGLQKVESYDKKNRIEKISWKIFWGSDSASYMYDDHNNISYESGLFERKYDYNKLINYLKSNDVKYDQNHNLVSKKINEKQVLYNYDALDRLIKVEIKNAFLVNFYYDPFNRLAHKKLYKYDQNNNLVLEKEKNFIYDNVEEIGSVFNENEINELKIISTNDQKAIAIELKDEFFAPLYDINGNISSLLSLNNGLVETYRYSVLGKSIISGATGKILEKSYYSNPWGYKSKRYDEDIDLYFLNDYHLDTDLLFQNNFKNNKKYKLDSIEGNFDLQNNKNFDKANLKLNLINTNIISKIIEPIEIPTLLKPIETGVKNIFSFIKTNEMNITFNSAEKQKLVDLNIPFSKVIDVIKRPDNIVQLEGNDSIFKLTSKDLIVTIDLDKNEILSVNGKNE